MSNYIGLIQATLQSDIPIHKNIEQYAFVSAVDKENVDTKEENTVNDATRIAFSKTNDYDSNFNHFFGDYYFFLKKHKLFLHFTWILMCLIVLSKLGEFNPGFHYLNPLFLSSTLVMGVIIFTNWVIYYFGGHQYVRWYNNLIVVPILILLFAIIIFITYFVLYPKTKFDHMVSKYNLDVSPKITYRLPMLFVVCLNIFTIVCYSIKEAFLLKPDKANESTAELYKLEFKRNILKQLVDYNFFAKQYIEIIRSIKTMILAGDIHGLMPRLHKKTKQPDEPIQLGEDNPEYINLSGKSNVNPYDRRQNSIQVLGLTLWTKKTLWEIPIWYLLYPILFIIKLVQMVYSKFTNIINDILRIARKILNEMKSYAQKQVKKVFGR